MLQNRWPQDKDHGLRGSWSDRQDSTWEGLEGQDKELGFIWKMARSRDERDLNRDVRVDLRWEGNSGDDVEDRWERPEAGRELHDSSNIQEGPKLPCILVCDFCE